MELVYAIKNVKYTIGMYVINNVLKFILRSVFIITLSVEYLGLNSLLSDVVMLLSVTELGIGSAIAYSLYKPLSSGDNQTVKAIMQLLKRVYYYIGIIILLIGVSITPFLDYYIKDNTIENLKYFYLFFLFANTLSYFFSYKWILLTADQKEYIVNYYHSIFLIILTILQIIFLFLFKSYWSFVILMLFVKVFEYNYISSKANKLYPFLNDKSQDILPLGIKNNIIKNTRALMVNKFSILIGTSSFSIIASKYIGLEVVGLYGNYALILGAAATFCVQVFKTLTSFIGSMLINNNVKQNLKTFNILFYASAWLGAIIFNFLSVGLNEFVILWLGLDMQLEYSVIILMLLNFYLIYMQNTVTLFKEGAGLYWQERFRPILESISNICLSLFLVRIYGILGIILGNVLSRLLTSFWIEPYILFKNAIDVPFFYYLKQYFEYTVLIFLTASINVYITDSLFQNVSIMTFIIKIILSFIITNVLWLGIFGRRKEMRYLISFIKSRLDLKIADKM